jgi:hypothetical protein
MSEQLTKIVISDMASGDNNAHIVEALRSPKCQLIDEFLIRFQQPCTLLIEDDATFITFKFRAFPTEQQNRQVLSFIKNYFETELKIFPFVEFWHLFSCLAQKLFPNKFESLGTEPAGSASARLAQTASADQTSDSAISLTYKVNSWLDKCSTTEEKPVLIDVEDNLAENNNNNQAESVSYVTSASENAQLSPVNEPKQSTVPLAEVSFHKCFEIMPII